MSIVQSSNLLHMHLSSKFNINIISHIPGSPLESHCESTVAYIFCLFGRGPPRYEGDRPRFGDRDGYRGGPRGAPGDFGGDKGGAPADFQPSFRVCSRNQVASIWLRHSCLHWFLNLRCPAHFNFFALENLIH